MFAQSIPVGVILNRDYLFVEAFPALNDAEIKRNPCSYFMLIQLFEHTFSCLIKALDYSKNSLTELCKQFSMNIDSRTQN